MDIIKILKYLKVAVKIITILPVLVEGVKTIVEKVKAEIKSEGL